MKYFSYFKGESMLRKVIFIYILLFTIILTTASEFGDIILKEQRELGNEIFNNMSKAIGDVTYIENIKTSGNITQPIDQGYMTYEVEVTAVFPNKFQIKFQDNEYIIVKKKGWKKYSKGYYESLSDKYIDILIGNLKRNIINLIKSREEYDIIFVDYKTSDEKTYALIELKNKSIDLKLLIDVETNLPHQMLYNNKEGQDSIEIFKTFLEFKDIQGIKYPVHTISNDKTGNLISEVKLNVVKFNIEVDKDTF